MSHPQPSTDAKKRNVIPGWVLGLFGGLLIGYLLGASSNSPSSQTPAAAAESAAAEAAAASADAKAAATQAASAIESDASGRAPERRTQWLYSQETDPLTDKVTKTACVTSQNEISQNAPYTDVHAELCIRQAPRSGLNVYVRLDGDGQILCTSYEGCRVKVRFDKTPLQSESAVGAADGSSNVIFLRNERSIVSSLRKSSKTLVEIVIYQAGNQTLMFNTDGLKWD